MLEGTVTGSERYKESRIGSRVGRHGPLSTAAAVFSGGCGSGGETRRNYAQSRYTLLLAAERRARALLCVTYDCFKRAMIRSMIMIKMHCEASFV